MIVLRIVWIVLQIVFCLVMLGLFITFCPHARRQLTSRRDRAIEPAMTRAPAPFRFTPAGRQTEGSDLRA